MCCFRLKGWMTDWHVQHNFTNPVHLNHFLPHGQRLAVYSILAVISQYLLCPWWMGELLWSPCLCLYVCLSACISQTPYVQISWNFICVLPVAVTWSCFDGNARFVLLVLWMTPYLLIIERLGENKRLCVFRWVCQGGGTRGEVCCLRLHLVKQAFQHKSKA